MNQQKFLVKIKLKYYKIYVLQIILGALVATYDATHNDFLSGYKKYMAKLTLPIKNSVSELAKTIQISLKAFRADNFQLALENEQLKSQILEIEYQNKELIKQNKCAKLSGQMVFQVLGFEQNIFKSALLIRATKELKQGYVAISSNGLVGIVTDVVGNIAQILTITDRRFSVPVKTKSNVHLIMTGDDSDFLVASAMLQNNHFATNIKIGEILYTSGEGGVFPCGIPVANVIKNCHKIKAKPIVNLDDLQFVKIIQPTLLAN